MRFGAASALTGLTAAIALAASAQAAPSTPAPSPAVARLQGVFQLTGRITVAVDVRGEHVGQKLRRRWTFAPECPTGACAVVRLTRQRAGGVDRLTLVRRRPGYYIGSGSFYAPLRCGRRTLRQGELVPFAITVQVTRAVLIGGTVVASQISATYTNRRRINLTPCVTPLIHDAARYRGQLLLN